MGNKYGQPRKSVPNEKELLASAEKMRAEGRSWHAISQSIGQTKSWIRYRIDPAYQELRKAQSSTAAHHGIDPALLPSRGISPLTKAELRERLRLIPMDTRDTTGRLMGDPIPGDRRRACS
jgi:hypothetical protein